MPKINNYNANGSDSSGVVSDIRSPTKFDHELYHKEDDVAHNLIRVKRLHATVNSVEKWKISNNNKVIFVIEGNKINQTERQFLKTVEGFNFILARAKIGFSSFSAFRRQLQKVIKQSHFKISIRRKKRTKLSK